MELFKPLILAKKMSLGFDRLDRRETYLLLIISAVFIILYIARIWCGNYNLSDSVDYLLSSGCIKSGDYFIRNVQFEDAFIKTRRPFVYPLFLFVFSSFRIEIILMVQTLVGIFNVYLMMQLYKKISTTVPYYFLILVLLTPSIFIYSQVIMTEWLVMTLLLLLSLLLFSEWTNKMFLYIQVITTLLAFTKPIFYPLIYLNLVYFAFYFYKKKVFSITLFLPLICLWLYLGFNNYRTGYTHFSSIENTNLIDYNLYYFKTNEESKEIADKWIQDIYTKSEKYSDFKSRSLFLKEQARQEIAKHLFSYSWYHFYTSLRGCIDPGRFDLMTYFKREDGKQGFLEILNSGKSVKSLLDNKYFYIYLLLVPLFLAQLIKISSVISYIAAMRRRVNLLHFYLLLVMLCYILISGPVNSSRYMMPLQGFLIVIGCLKIDLLVNKKPKV